MGVIVLFVDSQDEILHRRQTPFLMWPAATKHRDEQSIDETRQVEEKANIRIVFKNKEVIIYNKFDHDIFPP